MEQAELTPEENFLTDLAQGAITGASTGAVAGPWGALVGALAGAGLSAVQSATQGGQRPAAPPARPPTPPPAAAAPRPPAAPARTPTPAPARAPAPAVAAAPSAPAPVAAVDLQTLLPAIVSLAQMLASRNQPPAHEDFETTSDPQNCVVAPTPAAMPPTMHGHGMEGMRYAEAAELFGETAGPRAAALPTTFGEAVWTSDEAAWPAEAAEAAWMDEGEALTDGVWES